MINKIYKGILQNIFENGVEEINQRTNAKIKVSKFPIFFCLDLSNGILPIPGNRTIWPHISAAEVAWQTLGTRDPKFIMEYAPKLWQKFIEKDQIKAAYGFRWHKQFGRDQIKLAIEALKNDPTNRQIYISSWNPISDGLGKPDQPKNIPCPVGFTLNIIDGKLNMSVMIRSSDVFVGLPYDILNYALVLDLIANEIGVNNGIISFTLSHAHIYESHFEFVEQCLYGDKSEWKNIQIPFQYFTYSEVQERPHNFVNTIKNCSIVENFWHPKPEVIE